MTDKLVDIILDFLIKIFVHPEIVTVLIAAVPIVEARLAIPIAMELGIKPLPAWLLSFGGATMLAPLLLLVLIPFIKWLSRTKVFKKLGSALYDKFEEKSKTVSGAGETADDEAAKKRLERKKMLGVFLFVAIPLPLTGVWTGCAVASILGMKYWKALVSVAAGNVVASVIILLLCIFLEPYIDIIITVLGVIAIIIVIVLIVKIIMHKPKQETATDEEKE